MRKWLPSFILIFALASPVGAKAPLTSKDFSQWFESTETNLFSDAELSSLRNFHYVFVKGFLNESVPGYFSDSIEYLKRHKIEDASITLIGGSSKNTTEVGAADLLATLKQLAVKTTRPLVVIAHSKGAAEALAVALAHPQFASAKLKALFLIQGAIGGSYVADYVHREGITPDQSMGLLHYYKFLTLRSTASVLNPLVGPGLLALTTAKSKSLFHGLLQAHSEATKLVGEQIFYITTHQNTDSTTPALQCTAAYLNRYYGPSDGLVLEKDASLPEVGSVLLSTEGDHSDLCVSSPLSTKPKALRNALTYAILKAVLALSL
jgi:pimeloyl-ACP methyl ester carboxylesterase